MITKGTVDKCDSCLSCGERDLDSLVEMIISRSATANGLKITLCKCCIDAVKELTK